METQVYNNINPSMHHKIKYNGKYFYFNVFSCRKPIKNGSNIEYTLSITLYNSFQERVDSPPAELLDIIGRLLRNIGMGQYSQQWDLSKPRRLYNSDIDEVNNG